MTLEDLFLPLALAGLVAGACAHLAGAAVAGHGIWAVTTVVGLIPATWWVIEALRSHRLGVDVIALLALAGTLVVGETLAGAVITVMLASGRALESWAAGRARRELRLLLDRAPSIAHRLAGETAGDVAIADVVLGDRLLVKPGEVVPVDGRVEALSSAVIDESALTGEAQPVERPAGELVRSGTVNAGGPDRLQATTTAAESTYAGIVRLVSTVEASSAPSVRLADRYAGVFLAISLGVAALAGLLSGTLGRRRRRTGRGDPLPAHPRRPGGAGIRALPGRAARCRHQGRRGPGTAGRRHRAALRQDGQAHVRTSGRRRHHSGVESGAG